MKWIYWNQDIYTIKWHIIRLYLIMIGVGIMAYEKYLRILKRGNILPETGYKICKSLSEETLDRLTSPNFHNALIKPVLEKAGSMEGGICDANVNSILSDPNIIIKMRKEKGI